MTVNKILPKDLQPVSQEELEETLSNYIWHAGTEELLPTRPHLQTVLYVIQTLNLDRLLHQCKTEELFHKLRYKIDGVC